MGKNEARFVHPSEFGMSFPINTPKELTSIARAMNAGEWRNNGLTPPWEKKSEKKQSKIPEYIKVK
jgi:hypothetical protein